MHLHAIVPLSKRLPFPKGELSAEPTEGLSLLIVPGGVYGGGGAIFAPENLIFQSKNRFLAVSAPENPQDFSGNW